MKSTGIVRRTDDLWEVGVPKDFRRSTKNSEDDPPQATRTPFDKLYTDCTVL